MVTELMASLNNAEDEMDKPVVGAGWWYKISLGNIITILTGIVGFCLMIQQMKSDVSSVRESVTSVAGKVDRLQETQNTENVSLKGISDRLDNHDIQLTAHNSRFDSMDLRLRSLETAMATLETSQKLQSQLLEQAESKRR